MRIFPPLVPVAVVLPESDFVAEIPISLAHVRTSKSLAPGRGEPKAGWVAQDQGADSQRARETLTSPRAASDPAASDGGRP